MLPDQKGFTSLRRYLTGDTLAQRQAVRETASSRRDGVGDVTLSLPSPSPRAPPPPPGPPRQVRDGILATTADDFKAFGGRLGAMTASPETGAVVFGSKAAFEEANKAGAKLDVKTVI